jgi:hypothetical protein
MQKKHIKTISNDPKNLFFDTFLKYIFKK